MFSGLQLPSPLGSIGGELYGPMVPALHQYLGTWACSTNVWAYRALGGPVHQGDPGSRPAWGVSREPGAGSSE